jgi:hypothetical protein
MKILRSLNLSIILFSCICSAQTFDPAYVNTFGSGVIIASIAGYPAFDKYDPAQFDLRDGKFYVKGSKETTIDLRVILPKGTTAGKLIDKLKKEKPQNLKHKKAEYSLWQVWTSHTPDGRQNFTDRSPWPVKLSDVPKWSAPTCDKYFTIDDESKTYTTSGFRWQDGLSSSLSDWLENSKPGYKIYAIYRVCYEYSVPGGQIENKWDDVLKKFVPTKSTGGIGYVESDQIAAVSIEIFHDEISADRFKDNGNGSMRKNQELENFLIGDYQP